jgi:hypothetical protein
MQHFRWSWVAPVLACVWTCPCAAYGAPIRCAVAETSTLGSVVEVNTDDMPAPAGWPPGVWPLGKDKPAVSWRPPPAPQGATLVIGYLGSTLASFGGEPRGGHIRFRISPPATPDDTRVILKFPDGEDEVFHGADLVYGRDYGSDDETRPVMDIGFTSPDARWPKIKSAVMEGARLGVQLDRHGETLAYVMFNFANRDDRDALLAMARRKIMAADPQVCTDAPLPRGRMF